jgi:hypothetical protein
MSFPRRPSLAFCMVYRSVGTGRNKKAWQIHQEGMCNRGTELACEEWPNNKNEEKLLLGVVTMLEAKKKKKKKK